MYAENLPFKKDPYLIQNNEPCQIRIVYGDQYKTYFKWLLFHVLMNKYDEKKYAFIMYIKHNMIFTRKKITITLV